MQNTLIVWPPLVVVALNNRIECLCQRPALYRRLEVISIEVRWCIGG